MREVSEALRPSWKLAAGRLPWAWGRRWEERFKGVPVGSRALLSAPEARSVDISPIAACKEGAGLDEDFRQLSDEAPSEGLTTIPKTRRTGINSEPARWTESGSTHARLSSLHGGLHWWKRADTSARVCLREVVVGGSRGPRACVASSSSRSLGRTSSLMLVSSRLLGEMERFHSNLLRLASTGYTTR